MIKNSFYILNIFIAFLLMAGCDDQPLVPEFDPELFVDMRGYDSLNYKSPGIVNVVFTDNGEQMALSTVKTINNKRYSVSIFLFFKDKKEKTGVFPFTNNSLKYNTDYAVGLIEIGDANNPKQFFSDSGNIKISHIDSVKIVGTFDFIAYEKNSNEKLIAKDGIIDFTY